MSSLSPVPGWYPDPYDPNQLRYWDGWAWSEATTPAAAGHRGSPAGGVDHGGFQPGAAARPIGSGLGNVGDWFKSTFTVLFERIVPVAILLFAVPAVAYSLTLVAVWLSVADLRFDGLQSGAPDVSGFRPALLVLAGLLYLGFLLVSVVTWLAAGHQLYFGHTGQSRSIGASLAAALRRLPRTLLWLVLLSLAVTIVFGLLLGVPVVLAVSTDSPAPLALWLLTLPVATALAVWIGVRLFHLSVALVLAPGGTSPVRVSFQLTRGRWLATFGRALLLFAVLFGINLVSQMFFSVVFQAASFAALDFDPATGEPRIDGQQLGDVDSIVVGNLVPGVPLMVLLGVVYAFSQAIINGVWLAGAAGLYARAGGPVDERL